MRIVPVTENKKAYLPLLLLGDEQESMIDRYLERGALYVALDPETVALCVVTEEGDVLQLQNLAVTPARQRRGCGRQLIEFLCRTYAGRFAVLRAGTGDSPLTIPFYKACGFRETERIKDYFPAHYDHPIYEAGVLLRDLVVLERQL